MAGRRGVRRRRLAGYLRTTVAALLLVAVGACHRMQPIVELWSDRAELAAYVETFNAADGPVKVELTHVAQPAQELLRGAAAPDLLFGSWMASPELRRLLTPLDRMLGEQVAATSFFPGLLATGAGDGRQTALPFAFNLPVVVFARAAAPPEIDQFVLTVEELRRLGEEFVVGTPERLTRVGFSPLWNVDLVYYLAQSLGAGFAATADGQVVIDAAAVATAVAAAHDWVRTSHGSIASDRQFTDTYFHRPLYQLVLEGRVRMYLSDIASFALVPEPKREMLDFRWLSLEGGIPVLEGYPSFAIPAAGGNAAGARLFLSWIFQPEVQARLLATATYKRLRGFGLAGGFPALRAVSERILPRSHGFLIGRLPDADVLRLPAPAPVYWGAAKELVVRPWLRAAVAGGAAPAARRPGLTEAVGRWRRSADLP